MLHIKDIEAFANINEALFRDGGEAKADLSNHPAVLLARLMAAAQAQAEEKAEPAETAAPESDPASPRPLTMANLFGRMMFGRR